MEAELVTDINGSATKSGKVQAVAPQVAKDGVEVLPVPRIEDTGEALIQPLSVVNVKELVEDGGGFLDRRGHPH
jgi:hypothetical protein